MRVPVPLEKHDFLPQMGRFTLRDEGRTIAVGKVLRYKPTKLNNAITVASTASSQVAKEENKDDKSGTTQINTSASEMTTKQLEAEKDLVYDLDSGDMITKEEYNKRSQQRDMEGIDEDDEEDDDEEDGEDYEGT